MLVRVNKTRPDANWTIGKVPRGNKIKGLVLVFGVLVPLVAWGAPPSDGLQVITSPERPAAALDRQALLAVFLMRVRQWPDGTPVRVYVLPSNHPVHDRFARELLGTFPYVLDRNWDRLVFTGTGLKPEVVQSEDEMREKVLKTPGAIGYVRAAANNSKLGPPRQREDQNHGSP